MARVGMRLLIACLHRDLLCNVRGTRSLVDSYIRLRTQCSGSSPSSTVHVRLDPHGALALSKLNQLRKVFSNDVVNSASYLTGKATDAASETLSSIIIFF